MNAATAIRMKHFIETGDAVSLEALKRLRNIEGG